MNQPTIILRCFFTCLHRVRLVVCAIIVMGFGLTACGGDDGATPPPVASPASITTVAGTGSFGFDGDNKSAIAAKLNFPTSIAADGAGNVFIADAGNHSIRQVNSQGIITTVVGTGIPCANPTGSPTCGDGGPASAAQLHSPVGVAVDAAGNLFIADQNNHRVRRVDSGIGEITTVAGDGVPCSDPTVTLACGDGNLGIVAQLNFPVGVAVDSIGNLFIADQSNHRVRRVDAGTGVITTVAGTGIPCADPTAAPACGDTLLANAAQLHDPAGIALDGAGNLFIADLRNHRVRRVDGVSRIITTVAGTGNDGFKGDNQSAHAADLNFPTGVAVDGVGNVFIADQSNHRVRMVDAQSTLIATVAGNGTACAVPTAIPACGDGGFPVAAQLNLPNGVALTGGGKLLIADLSSHRVRLVSR